MNDTNLILKKRIACKNSAISAIITMKNSGKYANKLKEKHTRLEFE